MHLKTGHPCFSKLSFGTGPRSSRTKMSLQRSSKIARTATSLMMSDWLSDEFCSAKDFWLEKVDGWIRRRRSLPAQSRSASRRRRGEAGSLPLRPCRPRRGIGWKLRGNTGWPCGTIFCGHIHKDYSVSFVAILGFPKVNIHKVSMPP